MYETFCEYGCSVGQSCRPRETTSHKRLQPRFPEIQPAKPTKDEIPTHFALN
uniref:Uncharacterized protein n=1 Tax=Nelumbo nucifera TaxID=4432 RepID=A0A822YXE6_NELNU|nr:TPA_asm: hypothetical protein HUJ06_007858 [Nelumbo nucifera]